METKFTPGPWALSKDTPRIIKVDYSMIGSEAGPLIASAMGRDDSGFYATESEAVANALLISAAPELFYIAKSLIAYGRCAGVNPVERSCDPIEALLSDAHKAIAKATGEQP